MIELNKIYNTDCLEGFKLLPDESVDLIVTSPPYNIGIEYDSYYDRKPWDKYFDWCEQWMRECHRVLKQDGRMCINHYLSLGGGAKSESIMEENETRVAPLCELNTIARKIGLKHHSISVWEDITLTKKTAWGSWLSASAPYCNSPYEGILILFKERWKKDVKSEDTISKFDFMDMCSGVLRMNTAREKTKANFPIRLPKLCIELFSFVGDTVLDPFMGAGSTAVAAKMVRRNFIGFELSKNYCEIAGRYLSQEVLL